MKDALGQNIAVGDILFHGTTGRYSEFGTCRVLQDTGKTLLVERLTSSRTMYGTDRMYRISSTDHCVNINLIVNSLKQNGDNT